MKKIRTFLMAAIMTVVFTAFASSVSAQPIELCDPSLGEID